MDWRKTLKKVIDRVEETVVNLYHITNRRWAMSQGYELIFLVLVPASLFDLWQYRVPNALHGAALIISLIGHLEIQGIQGLAPWFLGILIPFFCSYLLYRCHVIGASDSKLFSVIGSFLGSAAALHIIVFSIFPGAIMAVAKMLLCHSVKRRFRYFFQYYFQGKRFHQDNLYYVRERDGEEGVIPYSIAISVAVLWYLCRMP